MLSELPTVDVPEWLAELSSTSMRIESPFPLRELLHDSLYYPASGFDGDPVKHLVGNILSFVYVDYGYSRDELIDELRDHGFRGYDLVAQRSVTERELAPQGWRPTPPAPSDGDPSLYRDWIKDPFCEWLVFQRCEDVPADYGPAHFSLLYLCADGVAAFQALYIANSIVPKAVAIIQPGHAFGCNFTNFEDPRKILARSVLRYNPSGQPQLLLYGGMGRRDWYCSKPCWPGYENFVCCLRKSDAYIGVWSKNFLA